MGAQEFVIKDQRLFNAWNERLKCTGGDLTLSKCYWTFKDYLWQNGTRACTSSIVITIIASSESSSTTIDHIPSGKMRTLVEVPIMPYNDSVAIVSFYQDNIKYYILRLKGANLNPQDSFFAYERCCPPSL